MDYSLETYEVCRRTQGNALIKKKVYNTTWLHGENELTKEAAFKVNTKSRNCIKIDMHLYCTGRYNELRNI